MRDAGVVHEHVETSETSLLFNGFVLRISLKKQELARREP
jgi:hypothetical protein